MKRLFYFILLLLFTGVSAFAVIRFKKKSHKEETVYSELLPGKNSITYTAEWVSVKKMRRLYRRK